MILRRRALISAIAAGALALCWQPKRGAVLVLAFVAPPPRCHSCYSASTIPNTRSSRRRVANTFYGWGEEQGMHHHHQDVASMRVEEIKQELERYGISTKDLLAAVLQKARAAGLEPISQDHNRNQLKASFTSSNGGETSSMRQGWPGIPDERPMGQEMATLKAYELELKEALRKHRGGMTVTSKQNVAEPRTHKAERPDEDDSAAYQAMKAYENQLKQHQVMQHDGRGMPITSAAAATSKTRNDVAAFQPTTTNVNERRQQQELRHEPQRGMTTTSASSSTTGTTREDTAAFQPMKEYENKLEQQKRATQEPVLENRSESLQAAVAEVRQQIGASSQEEAPKFAEAEVLSIEEMEVLEMEKSNTQKGEHWWNAYGKEDYAHMEVLTHKTDNKQHRNRWWNADPSEYADMEVMSENEDSASSANDNKEQRKRWWNADPSGYADMDSFSSTNGQVQQPYHEEKPWWNKDPTEYTNMENLTDDDVSVASQHSMKQLETGNPAEHRGSTGASPSLSTSTPPQKQWWNKDPCEYVDMEVLGSSGEDASPHTNRQQQQPPQQPQPEHQYWKVEGYGEMEVLKEPSDQLAPPPGDTPTSTKNQKWWQSVGWSNGWHGWNGITDDGFNSEIEQARRLHRDMIRASRAASQNG